MALVTTHSGPVAQEVGPVADGTLMKAYGGVGAVSIRGPVAARVPAGSVVALVAGYVAPTTPVIRAVAIAATQGIKDNDRRTVFIPIDPT